MDRLALSVSHDTWVKHLHPTVVGDLILSFETMEMSAAVGLTMAVYTADLDWQRQRPRADARYESGIISHGTMVAPALGSP